MKKIVLVIEDLSEEQEAAKKAAAENGFGVVLAADLENAFRLWKNLGEKISGIVTDLHFPETENDANANNPSGLAIVAEAVARKVPISVCSNINHHYAEYLKIVIKNLEKIGGCKIPFTMDRKDWGQAMEKLKEIIGE